MIHVISTIPLVDFALLVLLGTFVLVLSGKNMVNRTYGFTCLVGAVISISEYGITTANGHGTIIFWVLVFSLWPSQLSCIVYFVLCLTGRAESFKKLKLAYKLILFSAGITSFVYFYTRFTSVQWVKAGWGWVEASHGLPLADIYVIAWSTFICVLILVLGLITYAKTGEKKKKTLLGIVIFACAIQLIINILTKGILPALLKTPFPDYVSFGLTAQAAIIAWAIWKYGLFQLNPATAAEAILSAMDGALLLCDPGFHIVRINQAAVRMFRFSESELRRLPLDTLIDRGDVDRLTFYGGNRPEKGGGPGLVTVVTVKGGKKIDVTVSASELKDNTGGTAGYVVIINDISQLVKTENDLRESEERFKAIFEGSSDAVMLLTDKGYFDCNPATLDMFGFRKKEEFTRVHPADISPPLQPDGTESFPAAMERIKTAFEKGSNRFEWVHRRTSGEDFPAEVLLTAFDMNGKRVLQATVRDIIMRKQAENALRQREATLSSIYMAAPVGISVTSKRTMQTINRQITEISGYAEDELIGKSARIFFIDDAEFERVGRELYGDLRQKGRVSVETRWKRKTGVQIDILLTSASIEDTGLEVVTVLDITERKQAEDEIRSTRAFLDGVINVIADPVFVKDYKRDFVLVNDALCAMVGRGREGLLGKDGDDMFPKEQVEVFRKMDAAVLNTGIENVNEESLSNLTSGEVRTIITRKTRYTDPAGKKFLVGVIRDFTERKRAEQALAQSEQSFRSMFDITPEGVVLISPNTGRFVAVNPAMCTLLGYSEEEFLSLSPEDITPPEAKEIMRCSIAQLEEGRSTADHEGITLKKDGSKVNVLVGNRVLQWHGEKVYYTTFKDITNRKQAELALAESEKNFRVMFEASTDAMNLVGIKDGRFLEVNNAMCLMFGYSREELLCMSPRDLIDKENIPEQNGVRTEVLELGSVTSDEGTVVRKRDGTMLQVLISAQIVAWKGRRVIHSSLRDITPLKQIQDQLRKKNGEILEFTNLITHDLRKPLTTMNIVLGLAKKNAFGTLSPDGVDAIDTGIEASHYMQEMLEDLLACARLESGTQELVIEEIRFGDLVDPVMTRMKYQIEENKITIVLPDKDINLRADRKQLTRVLMNLVGNAINYIGSGTDKFIRIGWEQTNGAPVFMVADNGIGVPEKSQKDLFAKFKRGSNVSGVQGTGLGLSIVKGIIEAHGGKIWFESEVGKGTTFYFTLAGKGAKS